MFSTLWGIIKEQAIAKQTIFKNLVMATHRELEALIIHLVEHIALTEVLEQDPYPGGTQTLFKTMVHLVEKNLLVLSIANHCQED